MSTTSMLLWAYALVYFATPMNVRGQNAPVDSSSNSTTILFSYFLGNNSKTSAGVYKSDSTLIRTLWSGEQRDAGNITASWDGKDDAGNLVPDGNYNIQVLSNNATSTWEGVIGNSSQYMAGERVHHQAAEGFADLRVVGNTVYYVTEYNEGQSSEFQFSKDSIQIRQNTWINPAWELGKTGLITARLCTDGTNMYYGGILAEGSGTFTNPRSFVYARKISDNTRVPFANGVTIQPLNATLNYVAYPSTIDNYQPATVNSFYRISGMAVQQTGKYLFVSRDHVNSLHVIDKITGSLVHALTYTMPTSLSVQGDFLWMVTNQTEVKKYPINSNGTLGTPTVTLNGLSKPVTVQVTPDGTKVYVADAGTSQQVKIYNTATGTLNSTFGQAGGYATSPDVADNKFMFRLSKVWQGGGDPYPYNLPEIITAPIAFDAADNSWWLGDIGNFRVLHFSSSNVLIETMTMTGYNYSCSINYTDPTRVFSNYLEYEVDYSKPLAPDNGSWKLKKNWAYNVTAAIDDQFTRLQGITTLSNGRTYAVNKYSQLVELASTGLRAVGQLPQPSGSAKAAMYKDGSLLIYERNTNAYSPATFKKMALSGFDGSNNPVWASAQLAYSIEDGMQNPLNDGGSFKHQQITPSGLLIFFDETRLPSYHLGAIKPGTNKWLWRASASTHALNSELYYRGEFPSDGTFDIGNAVNFAGGGMQVIDRLIFWQYKGEFWKAAQTNKFNIFYDNGLFVGQFGVTGPEIDAIYGHDAPPMMAGNPTTMPIVKVGNDYYLYHNDESYHGGVHRWKINGLNTIAVQTISIVKSGTPAETVLDYVDLMEGLPFAKHITSNTGRWSSSSFSDKTAVTNITTYRKTGKDILFQSSGDNKSVRCSLGTNNLATWHITGEISYPEGSEPGDNFIEVLDGANRVIVRLSRPSTGYPNIAIKVNRTTVTEQNQDILFNVMKKLQPLTILVSGRNITVTYANFAPVSVSVLDPTANVNNPTTIRVLHNSIPAAHQTNLANLKFYKDGGLHFRSTISGSWNNITNWQTSRDGTSWIAAAIFPDSTANTIRIRRGHTINVTDSATMDQLIIEEQASLIVLPKSTVIINDGAGDDIRIASSGSMIVKSDSTGAGRLGNSAGNIEGDVTVEHYLSTSASQGYQLLSSVVDTKNSIKQYIKDNWQDDQTNTTSTNNTSTLSNYATHITGSETGSNGFDYTPSGAPSLFTFNQELVKQQWIPVLNTNATNLQAKKGYLIYIRGDRSIDLKGSNSWSKHTTLQATGKVLTGTQTFTLLESNGRLSLVTNPYPSPISWKSLYSDLSTTNSQSFENYYLYWDANSGPSGSFIRVNNDGIIPSGRGFFIKTKLGVSSPTFTIKEFYKCPDGGK